MEKFLDDRSTFPRGEGGGWGGHGRHRSDGGSLNLDFSTLLRPRLPSPLPSKDKRIRKPLRDGKRASGNGGSRQKDATRRD